MSITEGPEPSTSPIWQQWTVPPNRNGTSLWIGLFLLAWFLIAGWIGPRQAHAQIPQNVITTTADEAWSVYAEDLDGDGDADVLSASQADNKIAWYENLDASGFSSQIIIDTTAARASSVYAVDLDGDSDADVLSASQGDDTVAWYENLGSEGFSEKNIISTEADAAVSVYAADVDNDSIPDVLSASIADDKIAWYKNLEGGGFSKQNVISTDVPDALSVHAADLTGNGLPDVLAASRGLNEISWFENLADSTFSEKKVITTNAADAQSVFAADLDGDGDLDVLSASYADNKIAWYENLDEGGFSEQNVISINASGARAVFAVDLGDDGDPDVFSASSADDKIAWYKNFGDATFSEEQIVSTSADFAASVYATDLDGDADPDVLSASFGDDKIAWYENEEGVLPVNLASFEARADGRSAVLTWKTASETGNAGFGVQHRAHKQADWEKIGYVPSRTASGSSRTLLKYQFRTEDLAPGTHRFRLRQVDLDGSTQVTQPVRVDVPMTEALYLTAPRPHPVSETATLSFSVAERAPTKIELYNLIGRRVATLYDGRPAPKTAHHLQIDVSSLSSGPYFIRLRSGDRTRTRRVIVIH